MRPSGAGATDKEVETDAGDRQRSQHGNGDADQQQGRKGMCAHDVNAKYNRAPWLNLNSLKSSSVMDATPSSTASISASNPAASPACSAPLAAARQPCCAALP